MKVLWRCVFVTDVAVLVGLNKAILFAMEWLSVPRAKIEQSMIVAYFVCTVGNAWPSTGRWMLIAIQLPIVGWMWFMHRRPSATRSMLLLHLVSARVISLTVFTGMCAVIAWMRWPAWGYTIAMNMLYAAIYYAVSLPGGGEPGKRRKLALAKLKEMFGTSWVPVAPEVTG